MRTKGRMEMGHDDFAWRVLALENAVQVEAEDQK
jgi:hypothetical protein